MQNTKYEKICYNTNRSDKSELRESSTMREEFLYAKRENFSSYPAEKFLPHYVEKQPQETE